MERDIINGFFQMHFFGTFGTTLRASLSPIILEEEKAEISTADISKTRQLTPKESRLINSPTGKRENIYFWFWGEVSL